MAAITVFVMLVVGGATILEYMDRDKIAWEFARIGLEDWYSHDSM